MVLWKNSIRNIKKNLIAFFSLFFMMLICAGTFLVIANATSQIQNNFNHINNDGKLEQAYLQDYDKYQFKDENGNFVDINVNNLNNVFNNNSSQYSGVDPFTVDLQTTLSVGYNDLLFDIRTPSEKINKSVPEITNTDLEANKANGSKEWPYLIALAKNYCQINKLSIGSEIEIGGTYFKIKYYCLLPEYMSPIIGNNPFHSANHSSFALVSDTTFTSIKNSLIVQLSTTIDQLEFRFNNISQGEGAKFDHAFKTLNQKIMENTRMKDKASLQATLSKSWSSKLGIKTVLTTISTQKIILWFFILAVCSICIFSLIVIAKKLINESLRQIGILKAMGYRNLGILFNYSIFFIVCGLASGIIGSLLGFALQGPINTIYGDRLSFSMSSTYLDGGIFSLAFIIPIITMLIASISYNCIYVLNKPIDLIYKLSYKNQKNVIAEFVSLKIESYPFTLKFFIMNFMRSFQKVVTVFFCILFSSFLLIFAIICNGSVNNSIQKSYKNLDYNYSIHYDSEYVNSPEKSNIIREKYNLSRKFNILDSKYYEDTFFTKYTSEFPDVDVPDIGYFLDTQWENNFKALMQSQQILILENIINTNFTGYYMLNYALTKDGVEYGPTKIESLQGIIDAIKGLPDFAGKDAIINKINNIINNFEKHTSKGGLRVNFGFTTYDWSDNKNYEMYARDTNWKFINGKSPSNNNVIMNVFNSDKPEVGKFFKNFSQKEMSIIENFKKPNILPIYINNVMRGKNYLKLNQQIMIDNHKCEIIGFTDNYPDNEIFTTTNQYKNYFDQKSLCLNAVISKNGTMTSYLNDNISVVLENTTGLFSSPIYSVFDKNVVYNGFVKTLESVNFLLAMTIAASVLLSLSLLFSITNLVLLENKKHIMIMQTIGYRTREINFLFMGIYLIVVIAATFTSIPLTSFILSIFGNSLSEASSLYLDFSVSVSNLVLNFFILFIILFISFFFVQKLIKKEKISQILKSFEI